MAQEWTTRASEPPDRAPRQDERSDELRSTLEFLTWVAVGAIHWERRHKHRFRGEMTGSLGTSQQRCSPGQGTEAQTTSEGRPGLEPTAKTQSESSPTDGPLPVVPTPTASDL